MNNFSFTNFFDDAGIFLELFEKYENAWEVIPSIEKFIVNFRQNKNFPGFSEIEENIFIGKNVTIDKTARIQGGAIIGDNTTIGHAAYLRGGVLIGGNVKIGHATELKHSIVLSGSSLAHLNYVGDSIIGSHVNVSGGATLANYRLDEKMIELHLDNEIIKTNLQKFGGILGDNVKVGVNAVLNPGTILGKGVLVHPLVLVKGVHPAGETIR